jgi:dTDP-4-dehydrorhamnose 3,5-epimerase
MEGWGEPLERVRLHPLTGHPDHRGTFTEVFRESWSTGIELEGWDMLSTEPGALWGVHLRAWSDCYLVLLQGRATAGLCDLRGRPSVLRGSFHDPSVLVIAASRGRQPDPGLGCAWDDPGLEIPWPSRHARLSPRDAALPLLAELLQDRAALNLPDSEK